MTVGFIGAGNMGGALAAAVAKTIGGDKVLLSDPCTDKVTALADTLGARVENQNELLPIERAAQGDESAYAEIASRLTPIIQSIVQHYASMGLDADDLKQEASVGLLSAVRTYRADGGASFTTYASTCIRNRLISVARRHGARVKTEQSFEQDDELSAGADSDPAQQMQQREDISRLRKQLRQRLTSLEYQVLLARLSDCSYEQIASQLGISKKAVDNAVQRLRRKFASP